MGRVADRPAGADDEARHLAVDPVEPERRTPGTQLRPLQPAARRGQQTRGGGGDVLAAPDRLRPADADREGRGLAQPRTPPLAQSRSSRIGEQAEAGELKAERGRAASWPTRRRPNRCRAWRRSGSSRSAAAGRSRSVPSRRAGSRRPRTAPRPRPPPAARPRQPPGQAQAVEAAVEVGHERGARHRTDGCSR